MVLWYVRLAAAYVLLRIILFIQAWPCMARSPSSSPKKKKKYMLSREPGVPPKGAPLIQKPDTSLSTKASHGEKSGR